MTLFIFIANRFSLSKKNSKFFSLISLITILGIAIGVCTLILTLSVLGGFEKAISDKIVQFNSHLHINSFSNKSLPDYNIVRPAILNHLKPYAIGVSPFAADLAIIKSKKFNDGLYIKGISPEFDVSNLPQYIIKGKYDLEYKSENPPILIGKKLAEELQSDINEKVTLFTLKNHSIPSLENPPGIKDFYIAGIFESGMSEYDDKFAYINLKSAQEIFGMGSGVNGYEIKLTNLTKIDSLAKNLSDYLGYPYYVRTIYEVYQNIFTWIDLQKQLIPIALILIVIVAVFNIVGTVLMIVLERSNAIGILKSLGTKRNTILKIFLMQGLYLSTIGILIGNILAFVLSKLQIEFNIITIPETVYFMSQAPVLIDWTYYVLVSVGTLLISTLTAVIPGYIASKISPISALRFD